MSYRLFPTEYVWQDGSPVLAIRLRRDGVERYTTPDGQYVVAKGPQLWYWENADDFSINSDAGFRTKREAVASLAEYMLREGLGGFVQRNPKTRAELKWRKVKDHKGIHPTTRKYVTFYRHETDSPSHHWSLQSTGEHPLLGYNHKKKGRWIRVMRDGEPFGSIEQNLSKAKAHVQEWVDTYDSEA